MTYLLMSMVALGTLSMITAASAEIGQFARFSEHKTQRFGTAATGSQPGRAKRISRKRMQSTHPPSAGSLPH
jgi:hypothetical protein